jgi:hypothetical protein
MSASKIEQVKAFAGVERQVVCVLRPVVLVCDAVGSFVEVIKPHDASQTSCSDLP